jgi:uncharacterized membrane protein
MPIWKEKKIIEKIYYCVRAITAIPIWEEKKIGKQITKKKDWKNVYYENLFS